MTSKLLNNILAASLIILAPISSAGIIDFEDLDASGVHVTDGYQNLSWKFGSWVNYAWSPASIGSTLGAHSGDNYTWSNGGTELAFSGDIFNLNSLWIASNHIDTPLVTFEGLLDGVIMYTSTISVNSSSWTLATLNFNNIDELRFDSDINDNLLVDDIPISTVEVPEPSTFTIFTLGMIGLALRRFKKKT